MSKVLILPLVFEQMLFNSAIFLIFILLFFSFWPLLRKKNKSRWVYITIASFLFYGWWDWRFLFLLIFSGFIDYFSAIAMEKFKDRKKLFLYLSLFGNIGSLFIFKYSGFIANGLDFAFKAIGIQTNLYNRIPTFALVVPVGISFYTFQSLNYIIDVYRRELKPAKNIFHFFAYLSLFPHLVAGPILRAKQMIPQMEKLHIPSEEELWKGMKLIATGFFMKLVLADNLAPFVNNAFSELHHPDNTLHWWITITLFAFQIYYDFAGYSNIAIGLLQWMGYTVLPNFNHPYSASSLKDFWQRWHISLSSWFRDYVYFPLGGSKNGRWTADINMAIAMLLSGLWHGAALTFIVWGGLHALFLSIERHSKFSIIIREFRYGKFLLSFLLILQVWVAWVFFRAVNVHQALSIIKSMFDFHFEGGLDLSIKIVLLLLLAIVPEIIFRRISLATPKVNNKHKIAGIAWVVFLLICSVYFRGRGTQFIYFQF